jgi:PAS domain S-box-containing protein
MDDVISVQLAISKMHMRTLIDQPPSDVVAMEALAELNTTLAELEATNEELTRSNTVLGETIQARDLEARRYRELFERIPVACVVTDEWGVIEEANEATEQLFNVRRVMLTGKPISVFVPPDQRRAFRNRLDHLSPDVWEVVMQPRARQRLAVQLDVIPMPKLPGSHTRLCWVIHNLTPARTAASTEKQLAREMALRMEAQGTVTRLRALHVGLEQLEWQGKGSIPGRVHAMLETLVPRFALVMTCQFPGAIEPAIELGQASHATHSLEAPIYAPQRSPGRLMAWRGTMFTPDDATVLHSAANAVTALLCHAYNARWPAGPSDQDR